MKCPGCDQEMVTLLVSPPGIVPNGAIAGQRQRYVKFSAWAYGKRIERIDTVSLEEYVCETSGCPHHGRLQTFVRG